MNHNQMIIYHLKEEATNASGHMSVWGFGALVCMCGAFFCAFRAGDWSSTRQARRVLVDALRGPT